MQLQGSRKRIAGTINRAECGGTCWILGEDGVRYLARKADIVDGALLQEIRRLPRAGHPWSFTRRVTFFATGENILLGSKTYQHVTSVHIKQPKKQP